MTIIKTIENSIKYVFIFYGVFLKVKSMSLAIYPIIYKIPIMVYNIKCGDKKMKNNCCEKKTQREEKEKQLINNRLNRIAGQIKGIKNMIDGDAYCNDVLIQLSAVENSVKSLSNHILENHLYSCVTKDLENGKLDTIDELISLFKRFNKG